MQSNSNSKKMIVTDVVEKYMPISLINNNNVSKRVRQHRKSVFNQMEITSNLIEESISRPTGKVKSPFASENVSQKNVEKQNAESKFAQLANISRIFGKACSTHEKSIVKKLRKVRYSTQKRQDNKIINKTKQSIPMNLDQNLKPLKTVVLASPYSHKNVVEQTRGDTIDYSLQYFRTGGAAVHNMSIDWTKQKLQEHDTTMLSEQNARRIQRLIEGGWQRQTDSFSNKLNVKEFIASKSRFAMLQAVYNRICEDDQKVNVKHVENATECTLKALISYIENEGKMTEKEKLSARQRLQLLS